MEIEWKLIGYMSCVLIRREQQRKPNSPGNSLFGMEIEWKLNGRKKECFCGTELYWC